jgi:hypothetical protein
MLKIELVLENNNIGKNKNKNKNDESIKKIIQVHTSERTSTFYI